MKSDKRNWHVVLAAVALAAGVFCVDIFAPLAGTEWALYMVTLMLAAQVLDNRGTLAFAGLCTALTMGGYYLSIHAPGSSETMIARLLGIAVFWLTSWLVLWGRRNRQALRNHAILQSILRSQASGMICVKDVQGKVILANPALLRMLGRPEDQVIGKDDLDDLPNKELVAKIRANDRRVIEEGVSFDEEETIDTPDRRWTCLFHKSPLRDANGHIVGIIGVGIDITDRKRAEESLVASERKYRMLHETMTDAFVRVDMDGRIREFNKAYRDMLGYEAEEIYRLTYADLTPPKWHEFEAEIVRTQILPRGHSEVYSKEYRRKDGTMVPVELRTSLLRDDAGQPEGMWAIVRDITEREAAAAAIRQAREDLEVRVRERTGELSQAVATLSAILSSFHETAVSVYDTDGNILDVWVDQELLKKYGLELGSLAGKSLRDIHPPELADARIARIREVVATGHSVRDEYLTRYPRGSYWMETTLSPMRGQPGEANKVVAFIRDITERVEAEQKLHASETMYRALVETTDTGYQIMDSHGCVVDANAEYVRITGHARLEEILGRSVVEWTAPYDQERNATEVVRCIREGFVRDLRIDYVGRQGKVTPIEIQATVVPSGDDFQIIAISRDITGRVARQEAMRASEARYRGLFEQSPVSLWEMDYSGTSRQIEELRASGVGDLREYFQQHPEAVDRLLASVRVIAVNEATLRMHGASSLEEMLSRKLGPLARETRAASLEARLALAGGQTSYRVESKASTVDGRHLDVILKYIILPGYEQTWERAMVAVTDITVVRETQAALQAAHRKLMTAVEDERRRLARELHDSVAQNMVAMELSLRSVASGLAEQPEQAEAAKAFEVAVGRCNQVVREIREICHGLYPPALEAFGLVPSLEQLASHCTGAGLDSQVHIAREVKDRRFTPDVEIAVFRIAQEAVNNALRHSRAKSLSLALGMEHGKLVLAVKDNGQGFAPGPQTPPGLGLVSMRERAEAIGGELHIDSHKRGTTVSLRVAIEPA